MSECLVAGLALDYCVRATAIDACKFGFKTKVLTDAVKAVDPTKSDSVISELEAWGCSMAESRQIA